jgi:hypothetical protein
VRPAGLGSLGGDYLIAEGERDEADATFDGLFQRALLRHMTGELNAVTETQANITTFLIRSQPYVFILSAR